MKKIIILGAGIYQVPLIKAAKRLNLYVIVVSIPGKYPGFALADRVYEINTTNREAVLEMARREKVAAIVTTGTDVAVSTIGYVCDALNLPGISFEAARIATDKARMKQAFMYGNVSTAPFEVVYSLEDAIKAFEKIGSPAILKIVDKSGSRGITKVETITALNEAYEYAKTVTDAEYMLLEKYIDAVEIGIDAVVQNGSIICIVPHNKIVHKTGRTGIPIGHICPMSNLTDTLYGKIERETIKTIQAMGLDNCAVNMDVFVTEKEDVYVIEAAGRCGATGIPEVLSGYLGVDYYEMIIRNALGEPINQVFDQGKPTASLLIYGEINGILRSVEYDWKDVHYKNENSLLTAGGYVELDYEQGTEIHAFENGTHRIGQAIIQGDKVQEVLDKMEQFQNSVVVTVET